MRTLVSLIFASLCGCYGGGNDPPPPRPPPVIPVDPGNGNTVEKNITAYGQLITYGSLHNIEKYRLVDGAYNFIERYIDTGETYETLVPRDKIIKLTIPEGGATYIEPASTATVFAADHVGGGRNYSVLFSTKGLELDRAVKNINFFTTLHEAEASRIITVGGNSDETIVTVWQRINQAFGFDAQNLRFYNIQRSEVLPAPTNLSIDNDAIGTLYHYGISEYMRELALQSNSKFLPPYSTLTFMDLAHQDLSADGLLNGVGNSNQTLRIGNTLITAGTYRHQIPIHIIRYLDRTRSDNPKVPIRPWEFIPIARTINDSTNAIYGEAVVIPLDEGGPTITDTSPADGTEVSGCYPISSDIRSVFGRVLIYLYVDGEDPIDSYGNIFMGTQKELARICIHTIFDQAKGTRGWHTLSYELRDFNGKRRCVNLKYIYNNGANSDSLIQPLPAVTYDSAGCVINSKDPAPWVPGEPVKIYF